MIRFKTRWKIIADSSNPLLVTWDNSLMSLRKWSQKKVVRLAGSTCFLIKAANSAATTSWQWQEHQRNAECMRALIIQIAGGDKLLCGTKGAVLDVWLSRVCPVSVAVLVKQSEIAHIATSLSAYFLLMTSPHSAHFNSSSIGFLLCIPKKNDAQITLSRALYDKPLHHNNDPLDMLQYISKWDIKTTTVQLSYHRVLHPRAYWLHLLP